MKTLTIILTFLSMGLLYSQNTEPTVRLFRYVVAVGDTQNISPNGESGYFSQEKMLLGWHWSRGLTMSTNLGCTQAHLTNPDVYTFHGTNYTGDVIPDAIADSAYLIINADNINRGWGPLKLLQMKYEPTLLITNPGEYTIRSNDSTNAIFGFKHIQGIISLNPADENYNRLKLKPELHTGDTVLREPWFCNTFEYLGGPDNDSVTNVNFYVNKVYKHDYNGRDMYFTVNLRRLASTGIQDNSNVLAIKLPYICTDSSTGYIKFSQLPYSNSDSVINLMYNRGKAQISRDVAPTNTLYITRNMLPTGTDRDITITAKFICDGSLLGNPHFKPFKDEYYYPIDSLKIEVVYLGGDSIAIDWCKFECKVAQDMNRGLYDTSFVQSVQHNLLYFTGTEFRNKGVKPFRFYTVDEIGHPWIWGSFRYLNKLIGNISTTEINPPFIKHFNYYVNPPNHLLSIGFNNDGSVMPPFHRIGSERNTGNIPEYMTMGYGRGYAITGNGDGLQPCSQDHRSRLFSLP